MIGTSAIDHGQLCLSSSISAPSRGPARRSAPTGGTPRSSGVWWLSTKNAPRVCRSLPTVKISYSVLRGKMTCVASTRIGSGPGSRNERLAPLDRRDERLADPVGQREGDVEVLGEHHVGQLVERAVDVRVARVPAPLRPCRSSGGAGRSARPARRRPSTSRRLGVVLLAALDGERVAARREPDGERVGRERGVHLDDRGVADRRLAVRDGRALAATPDSGKYQDPSSPRIETRQGIGRPVSASTTSPRSGVGCDVPGVGGSGKNPNTTSPNHRPHDIRSPPTLGRGSPHPPLSLRPL